MKSTKTKTPMKKLSKEQKLRKTVTEQKKQIQGMNEQIRFFLSANAEEQAKVYEAENELKKAKQQLELKTKYLNRAIDRLNIYSADLAKYKEKYQRVSLSLQVVCNKEHEPMQLDHIESSTHSIYTEETFKDRETYSESAKRSLNDLFARTP